MDQQNPHGTEEHPLNPEEPKHSVTPEHRRIETTREAGEYVLPPTTKPAPAAKDEV